MSKKLNIIEAMKMPIGTEFKVVFETAKGIKDTFTNKRDVRFGNIKDFCDKFGIEIQEIETKFFPKFIPIQQPVSFMEVVDSKEDCRVEHPLLDIIIATKEDNSYNYEFNNKGYLPLNCLFHILGGHLGVREVKKVINEGKWYIEESEELEDERLS